MKKRKLPSCTLIATTYNKPEFLRVTLEYLTRLRRMPDEIIIADDGSGAETAALIDEYRGRFPVPLIHAWHEDKGFRLAAVRNLALSKAKGEYIIVIDGDILVHPDFVADHLERAQPGVFVTGSRCQLDPTVTETLCRNVARGHRLPPFFEISHGLNGTRLPLLWRLFYGRKSSDPEYVRGCNMAFWRRDAEAINGFNEEITGWGHEDTEFSWRLVNSGIEKRFLKCVAVQAHLFHKGRDKSSHSRNRIFMERARDERLTVIADGVDKYSKRERLTTDQK